MFCWFDSYTVREHSKKKNQCLFESRILTPRSIKIKNKNKIKQLKWSVDVQKILQTEVKKIIFNNKSILSTDNKTAANVYIMTNSETLGFTAGNFLRARILLDVFEGSPFEHFSAI